MKAIIPKALTPVLNPNIGWHFLGSSLSAQLATSYPVIHSVQSAFSFEPSAQRVQFTRLTLATSDAVEHLIMPPISVNLI